MVAGVPARCRGRSRVHALAEFGEDGLRGGPVHPVDPVVQNHHPLLVVGEGLLRVLDDERRVQAPVQLESRVRVEPVRPRVRDGEPVRERRARRDVPLGQARHPVHVVAQGDAVPVQGGGLGEVVGQGHGEGAARGDPDLPAGQLVPVRPRADGEPAAEVERGGGGGQLDLGDGPGGLAGGLGGLHLGPGRVDVAARRGGGGGAVVVHGAVAHGAVARAGRAGAVGAGGEQPRTGEGGGGAENGAAGGKRAHGSTSWCGRASGWAPSAAAARVLRAGARACGGGSGPVAIRAVPPAG